MSQLSPTSRQTSQRGAAAGGHILARLIFWLAFAVGVMALIIEPWRPRDLGGYSPRLHCANNLKQIGLAIQLYANDYGGDYPQTLGQLLVEDIGPNVFNCPSSSDTPASGATTQAIADDLTSGGHLSYIYLYPGPAIKVAKTPDNVVIAYEPLSNHDNDGMNVLFADGHVDWLDAQEAAPLLTKVKTGPFPATMPSNP